MGVGGDGGHTIGARGDQQGVRAHIRAAGKVLGGMTDKHMICPL